MKIKSRFSQQKGIAAVEATLVLPLFLFLFLITFELGRFMMHIEVVQKQQRLAAKYLADKAELNDLDEILISEAQNLVVYNSLTAGTDPVIEGLSANQVSVQAIGISQILVSTNVPYTPYLANIPNFFGSNISFNQTISASIQIPRL